ncbi:MAG: hypothetical protein NTV49_01075 [Kiritimatiellaeota bacterium]|nr:hypothetical protein [Kiritimatiellota bacterium]
MDLFPNLGEAGILDDLLWFGPVALQIILAAFFFWLTAKWMKDRSKWSRAGMTLGLVVGADVVLIILAGIAFKVANPTL